MLMILYYVFALQLKLEFHKNVHIKNLKPLSKLLCQSDVHYDSKQFHFNLSSYLRCILIILFNMHLCCIICWIVGILTILITAS